MTTKNIQLFRKNLDTSETNLYPLTEAQYVSMENGQTVQEILSDRDSDKYTPVITNSSSTFKVGQGDNVDLSSSMKEGAYDSCVLKGKTMVNCIQEPSSKDVVLPYEFADGRYVTINDTKESGALGIELKGQTLVNLVPKMNNSGNESSLVYITEDEIKISEDSTAHRQMYWTSNEVLSKFKTNTTYTVIANITENTLTSAFMLINAYAAVGGDIASDALCVPVNFTGRFVGVFRTVSDFTNRTRLGFNAGAGSEGKLTMKNDMVILEGDWTNQELPFDSFFTGMASCKMPILHTVGKNLFNGRDVSNKDHDWASYPLTLEPGTYVTSNDGVARTTTIINHATGETLYTAKTSFTLKEVTTVVLAGGANNRDKTQLEVGTTPTPYESYKSSILSLPEEVVLRSLPNGVCDTFNTRTGVYTQRIKEVSTNDVINNTTWSEASSLTTSNNIAFYYKENNIKTVSGGSDGFGVVIADGLSCTNRDSLMQDIEGLASSNKNIIFKILKSKLPSSLTVNDFKAWLRANPMTIQYELATPIVTKINLPSTLKSWNTTTHIYSEIPENTLYPILSHANPTYPVILKPSTKYSIVANSYSNSHTNSAINFNLGGATATTTVGNRVTTITTPSTLTSEELVMSGRGNKLNNVMVIEGDVVGDEPYFEGICDCKSPILSNVGKNLFDGEIEAGRWLTYGKLEKYSTVTTGFRSANIITITPSSRYTISGNFKASGYFVFGNKDGYITRYIGLPRSSQSMSFNTNPDECYGVWYTVDIGQTEVNKPTNIQLEEASTATSCEPYQSNTTTFDQKDGKTIVLRSLPSGVCDTLNVETGEYVQRIGEVVLNGNEERWDVSEDRTNTMRFNCYSLDIPVGINNQTLCTDKFPYQTPMGIDREGSAMGGGNTPKVMIFGVNKSRLTTLDSEGFKSWLSQNPVTVQYELATPVVSTIDVQGFPYAYTSGHVQLSSGHSGQSLTPKVEYSLSANKTGQINSNTKRVSAHQKQLDDFEAMMLTSLVQSAYDKAILQFNYEMQMMSLGGE